MAMVNDGPNVIHKSVYGRAKGKFTYIEIKLQLVLNQENEKKKHHKAPSAFIILDTGTFL